MSKNTYMAPDTQVLSLTPGGGAILTGSQTEQGVGLYPGNGEVLDFNWS